MLAIPTRAPAACPAGGRATSQLRTWLGTWRVAPPSPAPHPARTGHVRPRDTIAPRARSLEARDVELSSSEAPFTSTSPGAPEPLGPSKTPSGVNFSLFSEHATRVTLCIFDGEHQPLAEVPCHRTDSHWHVHLDGLPGSGLTYGYRVEGKGGWETGGRWDPKAVLLDPYAPLVSGRRRFGVRDDVEGFEPVRGSVFLGTMDLDSPAFDWGEGYQRPELPWDDLVIYEVGVRPFTAGPSSGLPEDQRGTFQGLAAKAGHLKKLGVTAVELLPVLEWDEMEFKRLPCNPREHMMNVWGYSHVSFMAPMSRLGSGGRGAAEAAREFKEMVRTLHGEGIGVILDVVFNHTAEGGDDAPYLISFCGIDNEVYYMRDPDAYTQLLNYSGCGNTVNANHPAVTRLILDSLRQWVTEYHVDGFRFDLATALCRDARGHLLPAPPLIRAIAKDPVLSQVKLIAEPWDIGAYQVGSFPNWDVWAEWNGRYRDDVRRFLRGDAGVKAALATRLCGSADLYQVNARRPCHSINFVTAHDGFSLWDLVSYSTKRNEANGEGGRDGTNDNFSWNCGAEGETGDAGVVSLRERQARNAMVLLLLSRGTPMLLSGDEALHTRRGNNNWYGHDSDLTWFDWDALNQPRGAAFFRFVSELIAFRRSHPLLGVDRFAGHGEVTWHEDDWSNAESRFLAFTLHGSGEGDLYVALNSHGFHVQAPLPPPPPGTKWCRVVDTNLPSPRDFTVGGNRGVEAAFSVAPFSSIVLIAKKAA